MQTDIIPLDASIVVSQDSTAPIIELRRRIRDFELIKGVVSAAFYDKPILIRPIFRDKFRAIAALTEKGILVFDNETKEFKFVW